MEIKDNMREALKYINEKLSPEAVLNSEIKQLQADKKELLEVVEKICGVFPMDFTHIRYKNEALKLIQKHKEQIDETE